MTTTFVVLGTPATKGSTISYVGRDGKIKTRTDSTRLTGWTNDVGWEARRAKVPMAPYGVSVRMTAVFQREQTKATRHRHAPTGPPDIDKLARALLDALTRIAYMDDAQVVELRLTKTYGPDTRTTITVSS